MTQFDDYCKRQSEKYGAQFIPPTDRRLIDAYNNGQRYRIKVRTVYGTDTFERWGYVALTCGWAPSFMLMRRRGQHGSSDLIGSSDIIIGARFIK